MMVLKRLAPGLLICVLTVVMFSCAGPMTSLMKRFPKAARPPLARVSGSGLPDFCDDMGYDGLAQSISASLTYLKRVPAERMFEFGKERFSTAHMIASLERFARFIENRPPPEALAGFIRENYDVYRSRGKKKPQKVLFTGYYEPILSGRHRPDAEYCHPVYARPKDLTSVDLSLFYDDLKGRRLVGRYTAQTVVPYYERSEIEEKGVLKNNAPVLAWVKDEIALFFLQIQGSGKVILEDGNSINVHYHTTNGRPYRSIGKYLIESGKIPAQEMSMQRIRAYLQSHPQEIDTILNYNPSYVFFKIEKEGPLGSLNVKLTPGRSLATDQRIFPRAALCYVETEIPLVDGDGEIKSWSGAARFVLNQDTGGAIRGAGRADLFWGGGPYAEIAAGHMQHYGSLYFLVLKPLSRTQ